MRKHSIYLVLFVTLILLQPFAAIAGNPASGLKDEEAVVLLNAEQIHTNSPEAQAMRQAVGPVAGRQLHLIQFAGPIQPAWYSQLEKTGVRIVTYIPFYSYLVYGDAQSLGALQQMAATSSAVHWEAPYRSEWRIHPEALERAKGAKPSDWFEIQLVDDYQANAATISLIENLKLDTPQVSTALGYVNIHVRLLPDAIDAISKQPDVVSIQPYEIPRKMDERQDQIISGNLAGNNPSGPGYLSFLASKGFTQGQFTASNFGVDVTDSGVDNGTTTPNHFGLYVNGQTTLASRVIYNRLVGTPNGGSTIQGCDGHGNLNTHIVAGFSDFGAGFPFEDASGFDYGLGVCPFVKVGSSVIFDPSNFTSPDYEDLQSMAYNDGMRISTNSWGASVGGAYNSDSQRYDALVRDAQPAGSTFPAAGNQEMVIVFAAGNAGPGANTVGSPGTGKNMITVGASENVQAFGAADQCGIGDTGADSANDIISFSGRGPTDDSRFKPEIVGPGTHVSGGVAQQTLAGDPPTGTGDDLACFDATGVCAGPGVSNFFPLGQQWFTASDGTSHSTPAVAGGAALLRQYFINNALTPPSPAMTKAFMVNSARYMNGTGANDTLPSNSQGMGEMNQGMEFDGVARILDDQDPAHKFTASGQQVIFTGTVPDNTKPFRVTLVWTDPPGPTSGSSFINNLDLEVSTAGNTYLGNVFSGANSVTGGAADPRNNTESIFLPAGTAGSFTITVKATNIAGDGVPGDVDPLDQDFALVCYNCNQAAAPVIAADSSALTAENCLPPNGVMDTGETVTVSLSLKNIGSLDTTNLVATLQPTGGVTNPSAPRNYGALIAGGAAVSKTFTFKVDSILACGANVTLTLDLQDGATNLGTATYTFLTGTGSAPQSFSFTGPPAGIPDDNPAGVNTTLTVAGFVGPLSDVNFTIDGTTCSAAIGSTTVGLDHTWVGDLIFQLTSPSATTVIVANRPGGNSNSGNNFCQTVLDDESAGGSIQGIPVAGAPWTGNFTPNAPLTAFDGQDPNGIWTLNVSDVAFLDTGNVRAWSLVLTPQNTCCVTTCPDITVSPSTLPPGNSGSPYPAQVMTASGGVAPYTFTISDGALPTGMSMDAAGNITGTPTQTGTFEFDVKAVDDNGCYGLVTVTLFIDAEINIPPVANDDLYNTPVNTPLNLPAPGVLANDADANGDPLTAVFDAGPSHGGVILNPDGSFLYTPNPGFVGSDTFTYHADDGADPGNIATVTIAVGQTALGLVADNFTNSVIVFNADTDTVVGIVGIPINGGVIGDVSISKDGTLGFVTNFGFQVWVIDLKATPPVLAAGPNPIFISNPGEDIATSPDGNFLVVCDGGGFSPVSVINIAGRAETSAFPAGCNAVDVCADNSVLVGNGFGGIVQRLTIDGLGNLTNTGDVLFPGDPNNVSCAPGATTGLQSTWATVTVSSFGIPGLPPIDFRPLTNPGQTVLTNGSGNRAFSRNTSVSCVGPSTVDVFGYNSSTGALSAAPLFSIPIMPGGTPVDCYFGIDQMAVHPNDNKLYVSEPGALHIYDPATGAPMGLIAHPAISNPTGVFIRRALRAAIDDSAVVAEDSVANTIDVLGNDASPESTLTITAVSDPPNGTAVINGLVVEYTPDPDYNGPDSFTYTVNDGNGGVDSATVFVTVTEVNDPPSTTDDSETTAEDTPLTFAASDLTTNDSPGPADESGQTLTVISVDATSAQGGTVSLVAGNITYTPAADYNGPDSFGYTVQDDGTTNGSPDPQTATGTVNVTVTEVNDPPIAVTDLKTTLQNTAGSFPASDLLDNDLPGPPNESGQTLTIVSVDPVSVLGGTVTFTGGVITYTPPPDFHGGDSFGYTIEDNGTTNNLPSPIRIRIAPRFPDPLQADGVVSFAVNCPITLSPAVLPNSSVGAVYNQTITAAGGIPPYAYTVSAGALPPGLSLDPVTGVFSGTPTAPGISSFIITATDASGCSAGQIYTVVIDCNVPGTGTIYGAANAGGGSSAPSVLFTIDPTTGAATPIGPIGFNSVSGMDFDASGTLWGAGLRASDGTPVILTIDPLTGAGTEVGPTGITRISDLSFRSDGVLYAYLEPFDALGTVNLSTGAVTLLGFTGDTCCGNGMAFSPGDVLYHTETISFGGSVAFLDTLDQTTGAGSFVANLIFGPPLGVFPRINAMKFDPASGALYGSAQDGFGGSGAYFLSTIDTTTGLVTIIGPTAPGLDAIAFSLPGIHLAPKTLPGGSVTVPYSQTITATGGTAPYTFTVTTGALPAGLSLNPSTGEISGTPTASGTSAFVITATDANGCTGSQLYVIDIGQTPCPVITISPATLPGGTLGFAYSQTVSASGGTAPYAYTVSTGSLPPGLSLDPTTGEIAGTPTAAGPYAFMVTATDANGCSGSQLYVIDISPTPCPVITLDPATLPGGTLGFSYSQTVSASGGSAPYSYAVSSGALPAGLSLDPSTGEISGTPTALGTTAFVITATDDNGCIGSQTYTITIECPVITLAPTTLSDGATGAPYSNTVTASGGAGQGYDYQVTAGALPPGLSLDSETGEISGTPTAEGTYSFIVTATDENGCSGTQFYSIRINCGGITVSPTSLPNGSVGAAYNQTVSAIGGTAPVAFSVSAGSLPAGLSLDSSTGVLSGTPSAPGIFTFEVTATDATGCSNHQIYTVVIDCKIPGLLYGAVHGTGGFAPSTLVTLDPATGSATTVGPIGFNAVSGLVFDGSGNLYGAGLRPSDGASVIITIDPLTGAGTEVGPTGQPRISDLSFRSDGVLYAYSEPSDLLGTVNLATGAVTILGPTGVGCCGNGMGFSSTDVLYHANQAEIDTLDQSTGVATFVAPLGFTPPLDNFPRINALKFDPSTGVLYGSAQDNLGFLGGQENYLTTIDPTTGVVTIIGPTALGLDAIAFAPQGIQLSPKTLPGGNVTVPYNQTISASGGAAPYTFTVTSGALPNGLSLAPSTGVISGTPTTAGPFAFVITAQDQSGCTGSQLYVIDINAAPCPVITLDPATLPGGTLGFAYSQTVSASGGVAPYSYAVTSGALPAGLSLDSSTGEISGTPAVLGAAAFVITATDANGCIGSQTYTINITCPVITLSPSTLPDGTVGTPYSDTVIASGGAGQGYTYSITAGALPPGLSIDSETGEVSGTPTLQGTYSFVVTATDENGCSGSHFYTIRIGCPAIAVGPSGLSNGVIGVAYSQTVSASGGTEPYTFTITAGALPSGLSLDTSTGEISGTPSATGVYTFEVTATDENGCTGSQIYTLAIDCADITLSPQTLEDGVTGTAYSQTVSASGGTEPYSYSVSAGSLPPGLSLDSSTGEISGTPSVQGTFSFVITATDENGCIASRFYTIRIDCPVITVSPSTLPNGTTGVAYSQTITAGGGTGPYSFSVTSGSLPPGLSLDPSTGVLDGTPTATGVFAFEITAMDSNDCTGWQIYAVTVNEPACPVITLSPSSLADALIGFGYSQTISASGSSATPYAYSVSSGVLPPGLSLDSSTGEISGTATAGGVFAFVIAATDDNDCIGSQLYTITVECPPITISPTSLPNGTAGVPYSQIISASEILPVNNAPQGSPFTFTVTAGTLPPGLTLNPSTGLLSGTPTTAGTFAFTVTATDQNGCSASLSYTISISCPTIDISPVTLPNGVVGVIYGQTLTAGGGTGPYTFAVTSGALPTGLSLATNGDLAGIPTAQGIFAFEVTATDANGCTARRLYLMAIGCATINVPPSLFPDATVGTAYSQTITATGGTAPYNYTVTSGALPAGLSLNAATGEISGIPSAAGTYSFTVTAVDANGCSGSWSYTIDAICPVIMLATLTDNGIVGTPYSSAATASGGTFPYTYAVTGGSLPPGLTLDTSTGVVSGSPTAVGDFTFDITATDFYNCSQTASYAIHIAPACLFCDDFEDSVLAPTWTYVKPSWSESGGELTGAPSGRKAIAVATPVWAGCSICSIETTLQTAGGSDNRLWFLGWYQDKKNDVELLMKQSSNAWILKQRSGGSVVAKQKFPQPISANTLYKVKIDFDGTAFHVFIDDVLAITLNAVGTPSGTVGFQVKNTTGKFEYITAN